MIPKTIHFDHFCPAFKNKAKLQDRICPFCFVQFASKAAMLRHRANHHKHKRAPKDLFDDINLEIAALQQSKQEHIEKIINHDTKSYLCLFEDGSTEWISLSNDNEHVKIYRNRLNDKVPAMPSLDDHETYLGEGRNGQ